MVSKEILKCLQNVFNLYLAQIVFIELTRSPKDIVAEDSCYRALKVSEVNLVLTELTRQAKDFIEFVVLTEFCWFSQETILEAVFTEQG